MLGVAAIPLTQTSWFNKDKATAGALGFAAGVMLWLSFVDVIGGEAAEFFEDAIGEGDGHDHGRRLHSPDEETPVEVRFWIAFFVFVGVGLTMMLDSCVARFFGGHAHSHGQGDAHADHGVEHLASHGNEMNTVRSMDVANDGGEKKVQDRAPALLKISFTAMIALALHNFPEGLVTFVGTSTGNFAVAIAIALHNIPEGAAIAVPLYAATGSYAKCLQSTAIAGSAQPFGALVGWLVLIVIKATEEIPDFLFGALYALTAGIMIAISLQGLIPEAFNLASSQIVMTAILLGFTAMEASIILLNSVGGHGHG